MKTALATATLLLALAAPALAAPTAAVTAPNTVAARLGALAQKQLGTDTRTQTRTIKEGACGGAGPTYVIDYQVRHLTKAFDRNQKLILKPVWQTVKTYAVPAAELGRPAPRLIDAEACTE